MLAKKLSLKMHYHPKTPQKDGIKKTALQTKLLICKAFIGGAGGN